MRRLSSLATLALLCTTPVHADEVLKNGDRLTGTAVSLAGGTLTFATPYGDVRLPWVEVTRLVVTDPILVTAGTAPPPPATLLDAGADGQATLQPGGVIPLGDIVALARPQPALVIDGAVGAGLGYQLFVKMQNGFRIGLATGFVTTLRHDLDYDRSPAPGRRNTDLTLSLTLGYRF